jgi:hypothetical protein
VVIAQGDVWWTELAETRGSDADPLRNPIVAVAGQWRRSANLIGKAVGGRRSRDCRTSLLTALPTLPPTTTHVTHRLVPQGLDRPAVGARVGIVVAEAA